MNPSELLTMNAMRYYDRQYMANIERLLKASDGTNGLQVKKKLRERLMNIYKFTNDGKITVTRESKANSGT